MLNIFPSLTGKSILPFNIGLLFLTKQFALCLCLCFLQHLWLFQKNRRILNTTDFVGYTVITKFAT